MGCPDRKSYSIYSKLDVCEHMMLQSNSSCFGRLVVVHGKDATEENQTREVLFLTF